MEKHEFFEVIREGPYAGQYRILIDDENRWGPIMDRAQAEETWSRFKQSGKTFDEFVEEFL